MTLWRLRSRTLDDERGPLIMGILNVTPDSFSDGGDFDGFEQAVRHGLLMAEQGADIIDVGGESTRPGAGAVSVETELSRVVPVVEALAGEGLVVSIDTSKARVADACVSAGAEIVNDISALSDPDMAATVAARGAGLVLMHMRGTPRTMQDDPQYGDVTNEVLRELEDAVELAKASGVDDDQICIDPGIGFGKNLDHNLTLMAELGRLVATGYPVLVGASRKSFLGSLTDTANPKDRDTATAATTALAAAAGVFCVRVHDVPANRQSALVAGAIVRAKREVGT